MNDQLSSTSSVDRQLALFAGLLLAIFTAIVIKFVVTDPAQMSMTYRLAGLQWLNSEQMYTDDIAGFLYPPQFAMLYAPFSIMPLVVGEVAVRILAIALLFLSFYCLARLVQSRGWGGLLLLLTILSMPALFQNAVAGQATIPLLVLLVLATVQLAERRWWAAALLLTLALAVKPLALAAVGLAGVVYWRTMSWRLVVGIAVFVLIPLLVGGWSYVLWQYQEFVDKALNAGAPPIPRWHDIRGLLYLGGNGVDLSPAPQLVLRALGAAGSLGLCWLAKERLSERGSAIVLLAVAVCYLVLFNPRSENFTYLLIMPVLVLYWVRATFHDQQWIVAILLAIVWLGITARYELVGTNVWLTPLLGFVFLGVVVWKIVERQPKSLMEDADQRFFF